MKEVREKEIDVLGLHNLVGSKDRTQTYFNVQMLEIFMLLIETT